METICLYAADTPTSLSGLWNEFLLWITKCSLTPKWQLAGQHGEFRQELKNLEEVKIMYYADYLETKMVKFCRSRGVAAKA